MSEEILKITYDELLLSQMHLYADQTTKSPTGHMTFPPYMFKVHTFFEYFGMQICFFNRRHFLNPETSVGAPTGASRNFLTYSQCKNNSRDELEWNLHIFCSVLGLGCGGGDGGVERRRRRLKHLSLLRDKNHKRVMCIMMAAFE